MKFLAVCLAMLLTTVGVASPAWAGPREDVAARLAGWTTAFGAGDSKSIGDVYAPDARLWGTLAKAQDVGSEAIGRYFDNAFANLTERKITVGEHAIRDYGDAVVASGAMNLEFTRKDGSNGSLPVRFSMTFVKTGTTWRIVDHHSSPLPK